MLDSQNKMDSGAGGLEIEDRRLIDFCGQAEGLALISWIPVVVLLGKR